MVKSSLTEIDIQIAALQKKRQDILFEETRKEAEKNFNTASVIIQRLIEDLHRLNDLGYVPKVLLEPLTDRRGTFNPGMFIKKPRVLKGEVEED